MANKANDSVEKRYPEKSLDAILRAAAHASSDFAGRCFWI
jgi:hypothetical protein